MGTKAYVAGTVHCTQNACKLTFAVFDMDVHAWAYMPGLTFWL